MELTLKNFWNAAINPDDEYAPYAPQTVTVRGIKDDENFIQFADEKNDENGVPQSNLILNYYNFLDQNKANCNTGIKIDLRDTEYLCGKTQLEIRVLGVTELDNTNNI